MRLLFVVLLVLAGAAAAPAQAQSDPFEVRYVWRCAYGPTHGPENARRTGEFLTPSTINADEMKALWHAWIQANVLPSAKEWDSYCWVGVDQALPSAQDVVIANRKSSHRQVNWMPDFATPYTLPRDLYYYCVAPEAGLRREFVTDLFKAPMPDNIREHLGQAALAHVTWLRAQGFDYYSTNMACHAARPEAFLDYTRALTGKENRSDQSRFAPVRSAWPGVDKPAAPNLIDDRAARAKYAAMRITSPQPTAKAAPPPKPAAKPTPASQTAALTVKEDTSLRDAGKAWDEQVKKSLAAEAQKQAETAAKAVQANAKKQAEIEKFFAERRRQGRAQ